MQLQIKPFAGKIGAIIEGWVPDELLQPQDRETISKALQKHLVLIFRGHRQPTDDELIRFGRAFGELLRGSEFLERPRDHPEILRVGNLVGKDGKPEGTGGVAMMDWHADYSYSDRPGITTFLNAVELPKEPPHTYFSDQYHALETLPEAVQQELHGLSALHSVSHYYKPGGSDDADRYQIDRERDRKAGVEAPPIPEAEHRVIVRHPETGRKALYVSPAITRSIIGLNSDESNALLARLHAHSTQPDNVLAHDWMIGDLVMFDTLGTLHKRDAWDSGELRYMRQMSTVSRID